LRRLDSPLVPLGIAAIAYLLLIIGVLGKHGYDPSFFVAAGDQFSDPALVPKNLTVLRHSAGYDGQFYYRLALNPFTTERTEFGITLDEPAYRQQRIVYPLIVWALSLGRAALVPVVLVLVNYLALCAIGWMGGLYAQSLRRHALWGLAFPLYVGFQFTLLRDLGEILAACFLLAGLWLLRRDRPTPAALLLGLAMLTKETALLAAVSALGLWAVETRSRDTPKWHVFLILGLPVVTWQLILLNRWRQLPVLGAGGAMGLPLNGLIPLFQATAALQTRVQRVWFTELVFLLVFAAATLVALRSSSASRGVKLAWLLYAGLASLLTDAVWVEDWAFMRALTEVYLLGVIILLGTRSRIKAPALVFAAAVWLLLFKELMETY
jgi:hypothetical protein